ncbi:hypothetical protein [Ralstonia solanacearum]|uniref:hypothetical protein n=1 Tax=Ralstonia solanacearum TaxID=305 RepID=UPI000181651B|nr:hypothetical protein [Ralstonia solanacearum]MDC6179729.1 hypothetical protein [Ralstonia solanacearum]MDC6239607.1 hypothetical protein [Ralstonia solanacearum]
MKFYHFTSVSFAETILSKGISRGHVKHGDGSIRNSVVWLTTDPDVDGHGLTTGRETMTASSIEYLTRVEGAAPKNGIFMNKTRVRLTVDLPEDTATLMSFVEYYARRGEKPDEAKMMGLSAYVENPWRLPLTKRRQLMKTTATKEGTWWLSFVPISADEITRVEYNSPAGFVDYDFETHGRRHLYDAGFVVPSAATLESLRPLVPCDKPFEKARAFAICVDAKHDPHVVIRGGGQDCPFDAVTGATLFGMSHPNGEALSAWVRDHSAELLDCWAQAVEVHYNYYPSAGTPRAPIRLNP